MSENKLSKYPVLRIEPCDKQPSPIGTKIFLDDWEIGSFITSLELHITNKDAIHAHISILVRPDIPQVLLDHLVFDNEEVAVVPTNQVGEIEELTK